MRTLIFGILCFYCCGSLAHATKCGIPHMGKGRWFDDECINEVRHEFRLFLIEHINKIADAAPNSLYSRQGNLCRLAITFYRDENASWEQEVNQIARLARKAHEVVYATTLPILAYHRWTREVSNLFCGGVLMEDDLFDCHGCDEAHQRLIAAISRDNRPRYPAADGPMVAHSLPFEAKFLAERWHEVDALQEARLHYFRGMIAISRKMSFFANGCDKNKATFFSWWFERMVATEIRPGWMISDPRANQNDDVAYGLSVMRREWGRELRNHTSVLQSVPLIDHWDPETRHAVDMLHQRGLHDP